MNLIIEFLKSFWTWGGFVVGILLTLVIIVKLLLQKQASLLDVLVCYFAFALFIPIISIVIVASLEIYNEVLWADFIENAIVIIMPLGLSAAAKAYMNKNDIKLESFYHNSGGKEDIRDFWIFMAYIVLTGIGLMFEIIGIIQIMPNPKSELGNYFIEKAFLWLFYCIGAIVGVEFFGVKEQIEKSKKLKKGKLFFIVAIMICLIGFFIYTYFWQETLERNYFSFMVGVVFSLLVFIVVAVIIHKNQKKKSSKDESETITDTPNLVIQEVKKRKEPPKKTKKNNKQKKADYQKKKRK